MMDVLQGIGYGIVALAILVVVGLTVIDKLGDTTAACGTGSLEGTVTYDAATNLCGNTTDTEAATGTAFDGTTYLATQLGSSGLSGWVPAIIAVAIGALFLSYFMGRKRR